MILSEFLVGRDVKINAVSNYISRNPELFMGHIKREGKNTVLDDEAVRILEEKYPLQKPTIIVNGIPEEEHRAVLDKLIKAQEVMLMMQTELSNQKLLNAENEAKTMLLEDRQKRAEEDKLKAEEEVSKLKAELEAEKSKTWFQKLRGK